MMMMMIMMYIIKIDQHTIRVDDVRAVYIKVYIPQSCPCAIGFNENTLRVSGDMLVPRNFTSLIAGNMGGFIKPSRGSFHFYGFTMLYITFIYLHNLCDYHY